MASLDETIVQQYAQHLLAKAGSVVRNWTIGGVVFGAVLGVTPAFLGHNFIAHGAAGKFAVVLGALAGGIAGRTLGEKRGLDLRFQAQMSLRQLEVEHRLVAPVMIAPIAAPQPPVSAPVVTPAPVVAAPPPQPEPEPLPAPAPVVAPVPVIAPVQVVAPPPVAPPPAPAPLVLPEPEPVAAEVAAPEPTLLAPPPLLAPVPLEQPAPPPLIAVAPVTPVAVPEPAPAPVVPAPTVAVEPPLGPRLVGSGPELPPVSLDSAG